MTIFEIINIFIKIDKKSIFVIFDDFDHFIKGGPKTPFFRSSIQNGQDLQNGPNLTPNWQRVPELSTKKGKKGGFFRPRFSKPTVFLTIIFSPNIERIWEFLRF